MNTNVTVDLAFQYMLLLRGATMSTRPARSTSSFQYMLLLRGATGGHGADPDALRVSIHAPLARSNFYCRKNKKWVAVFQYMLLLRGATFIFRRAGNGSFCFNTCSSCEEQLLLLRFLPLLLLVSIHAPLARSNSECPSPPPLSHARFNTCSSCEEQPFPASTVASFPCFNTCSSCEEQHG